MRAEWCLVVGVGLLQRLVPDELWELVAPLLPLLSARRQGAGTAPRDERAVFAAVACVLTSGCAWQHLPETFGVSPATAHRRFTARTTAGVRRRPHRKVLGEPGARDEPDWTSAIVDTVSARAGRGLADPPQSGRPRQVDRGRKGSKLRVLPEARGVPLAVAASAANTHDIIAKVPLLRVILSSLPHCHDSEHIQWLLSARSRSAPVKEPE